MIHLQIILLLFIPLLLQLSTQPTALQNILYAAETSKFATVRINTGFGKNLAILVGLVSSTFLLARLTPLVMRKPSQQDHKSPEVLSAPRDEDGTSDSQESCSGHD